MPEAASCASISSGHQCLYISMVLLVVLTGVILAFLTHAIKVVRPTPIALHTSEVVSCLIPKFYHDLTVLSNQSVSTVILTAKPVYVPADVFRHIVS